MFKVGHTSRYSHNYYEESVNQINVIDVACKEYAQEVLEFSDSSTSGNLSPSDPIIATSSPSFTCFKGSDFILEEIESFLCTPDEVSTLDDDFDPEGDIALIENFLNEDPSLNLSPMKNKDLKQVDVTMTKPLIEEPPDVKLKDLPPHLEYAFLERTDKLPVIISKELKDEEKATLLKVLKSHKWTIAWKIFDINGIVLRFCTHKILMEDEFKPVVQHQRRVNPKIHEIPIDLQDQGKTTFTCPYGTFVDRRMPFGLCNAPGTFQRCMMAIFHDMIEERMEVFMDDFSIFVDSFSFCLSHLDKMLKRAKVDVIPKLPHPTSVKGVRSFLGHAGFYRRFIQYFSKIAWPMTHLLEKETPFIFSKECIEAFNTLKKKLTKALILVAPDWDLPFEIICDASDFAIGAVLLLQELDVVISDKKGAENLAAGHLSRLENPHQDDLENKQINKIFPLETLRMISFHDGVFTAKKPLISSRHAIMDLPGDIIVRNTILPPNK
uniref:Reverse transcriptase domain-containing protein n=1 Tax=Tanacetum cinerariifolium TaxID=118510 RepID=A0A6L2LZW2_TANCI|nr:reverse transcriptase domain-containing protein [Tanacetum cinerariifolium]